MTPITLPARRVPQSPGLRRGVVAALVLLAAGVGGVLEPAAQAASPEPPANQPLVVLLDDHTARTSPGAGAPRIELVEARRPLTGVRTVLPVLGRATSSAGKPWVRVRLPGRPNGHRGWIASAQTKSTSTEWHLALRLSSRVLSVRRNGRVVRRFPAVVGNPWTPTPRGRFFIEESLTLSSQDIGGPFALATSARSTVLQEFAGGPGQIALHGTDNLYGALGTAASHGCIRLSPGAITWLARRIGGGVPLTVVR